MKKIVIFLTCLLVSSFTFGQDNPLDRFDFLIGEWGGIGSGFGNDKSKAFCFFSCDNDIEVERASNGQTLWHNTTVSIIFFVNLKKTHNLTHRADENAIIDAENIINSFNDSSSIFKVRRILRTVERVYNNYNYTRPESLIDNEPYTVFSFECDLKYLTEIC